jgi:glycosyltransferase involved in cell wall biosynthesis
MATYLNPSSEFPNSLRNERILLASESLGPINGVSRTTTNLILSLQAQDVPLKLVAPHYINSKSRGPLQIGTVRRLGGIPLPYTPELTVAYPFRLDRIAFKFKPTLIYLASPASVGFQALLQIRCMSNPPVVMANFQTDLSAYAKIIFPAPLDSYIVWMLQMVQGWLYNHPALHTIFYPSTPVRNYLIDAGVPEEKLVHLGRGVDTVLFNPCHRDYSWRKEIAPRGELILACVGRLAPEKGFPFLARVATKLQDLHVPFKLLIVGGNRNAAVEQEIRDAFNPVGERVIFTGFLEGEALARAYATADAFVHCSVTETFGLVGLEAMACGLPVVARDEGGPSEIVKEGRTGYLTPAEDEDAFVERVRILAADPALRVKLSSNARAQAEDSTWENINLRVAQRMQLALDERRLMPVRKPIDLGNQALNWIVALGATIGQEMLFTWAILVVTFFWIATVVPLLIHGNIVFSQSKKPESTELKPPYEQRVPPLAAASI